ncbi:MAG: hypothetical protein ABF876_17845 [Acetobacter aceti]
MGDIWDYDQLIRIRRATEKMANNAISVADYNAVVRQNEALQQEIMRLRDDAQYWERQSNKFERNRDEFSDYAASLDEYASSLKNERDFYIRRSERATARVAELEREIAALKGHKA